MISETHASPLSATGEHTSRKRTTSLRRSRSTIFRTTGQDKNSQSSRSVPRSFPLTLSLIVQVPEGDQEGSRCSAHAAKPRFRVQPDRKRVTARPGAVDTSLRYLKGRRAAVWLLNDRQTMDNVLTAYGRNLFASYHYTDMYSTVFFAFSLLIHP